MKDEEKTCAACRWSKLDYYVCEAVCENPNSGYRGYSVDKYNSCEEWEAKD